LQVLPTGGAGFIGSRLVEGLTPEGHGMPVGDHLPTSKGEYVNPKARLYQLDIRSLANIQKPVSGSVPLDPSMNSREMGSGQPCGRLEGISHNSAPVI
jgi:nucleoside-diphosphate-sugar epimerase